MRTKKEAACSVGACVHIAGHEVDSYATLAHRTGNVVYFVKTIDEGRRFLRELTARLNELEAAMGDSK